MFSFMDRQKYMNGYMAGSIEQIGGTGAYRLEYSSMLPYCEECFALLPEEQMLESIHLEKPFVCKACGHKMPVRSADAGLKQFHPKAIGVINDSSGNDSSERNTDKDSLLVFKCMTCGAALELSDDTARTIKCHYCDNENYLPDSIWTKLHPNKEVQPLFVLLELSEDELKDSIDYFLKVTALNIYNKHFENFIRSYFERPFVTTAFLTWLKYFVSAKNNEDISFNMDITKIQKYFYDNLKLGLAGHPAEVKKVTAEFGAKIPAELQTGLASDSDDLIRLALAGNSNLTKETTKLLKNDKSEKVRLAAGKHKTGFFSKLFG
jgi:DNA-directed RNA polymerase subunit RPC12/RpoP